MRMGFRTPQFRRGRRGAPCCLGGCGQRAPASGRQKGPRKSAALLVRGGEATQHTRNVISFYQNASAESTPGCGWGDSNSHELSLSTLRVYCVYQFRHILRLASLAQDRLRHHVLALRGSGCCDAFSQHAMPLARSTWPVGRCAGSGIDAGRNGRMRRLRELVAQATARPRALE